MHGWVFRSSCYPNGSKSVCSLTTDQTDYKSDLCVLTDMCMLNVLSVTPNSLKEQSNIMISTEIFCFNLGKTWTFLSLSLAPSLPHLSPPP